MSLQAAWAGLFIDALARAGVRDVIVSPGSRSTPFVLAAAEHPELACHDVIDERSAGFVALGLAKVRGAPVVLLCTSGTALSHYFPAVIEASMTFTPLVVVSADRPLELHHAGANQTIDQVKLFGDHVRRYVELPEPADDDAVLRAARRAAAQAVAWSLDPTPGPVHILARARKPLVPDPLAASSSAQRGEALRSEPVTRVPPVTRATTEEELGPLVEALEGARRGLLLAGPAPVAFGALRPAVQRLVARAGLVLAAESTSQLRHGPGSEAVPRLDGADAVFRSETGREWLAPDVILQLGAHPVATGTDRLLGACSSARRFVVAPHGWPDPAATAEVILRGEPAAVVEAVCDRLGGSDSDRTASYRAAAAAAQGCVWRQVDEMLSAAGEALTEGAIARAVVEAVPPEGLLSVGNSLPVRQLDAYVPSSERPLAVLCQRGASGIDGLVSSAAGAARGWSGPVVLYLGDVSFLHDVGGLLAARTVPRPFVVVAVHNDGGRIFEQLPVAQRADLSAAMAHFTTPHGLSLGAIAAAFGHRQRRVDSVPALRDALHDAVRRDGCTVIEAVVPPSGAYAQNSALWSGVERALATERARWNP